MLDAAAVMKGAGRAARPLRLPAVVDRPAIGPVWRDRYHPAAAPRTAGPAALYPGWWRDTTMYELRVGSFKDSNGDGIGDFRGATQKLDYLERLGVDTIWLTPFYPSPMKDDGYDVADYLGVDPRYGTLDDFKGFVDEAHRRGMKVVTELVVNHTSDQHPWFRRAVAAPPGSAERNWYVWSDTPDRFPEARVLFNGSEKSNWAWNDQAQAYYFHRYKSSQPDLNYDHPAVREAVLNVVDHWLGMGVDGLRLDAVPNLYERDGTDGQNLPETHAFLRTLRHHIDEKFPNRVLLAEANMEPAQTRAYFGKRVGRTTDEVQMAFNFPVMPRLYQALTTGDVKALRKVVHDMATLPGDAQWATFLRNHDELTLEKVSDAERQQLWQHYAPDERYRIYQGIRRRLTPLLGGDRRQVQLLDQLLLSLPGTPVLYYGDEIGMGDALLADRDGVRTPMQWSKGPNAGFSKAVAGKLALPIVRTPGYDPASTNVADQERTPGSLLDWNRRALQARRAAAQVFGRGSFRALPQANDHVLSFVRSHGGQHVVVLGNFTDAPQTVSMDLSTWKGAGARDLMGGASLPQVGAAPYQVTLGPYEARWIGLDAPRKLASNG